MDSKASTKPHAVFVPFPSQGHVNPFFQLAKLVHSKGFYVTFVNTEFNQKRLLKSKGLDNLAKGPPDFQFETISDGLPPSDRDATQDPQALCVAAQNYLLGQFRDLLGKLKLSEQVPQVTCIFSDGVTSFGVKAAAELGIPVVQFWAASACGLMGCLQYPELIKRGIVPFKDENFANDGSLDMPLDWIPGMKNIRLKDIPTQIRTTDPNDFLLNYLADEVQSCLKASAIVINTFDAFENEVIDAIKSNFPSIYALGPLSLLSKHMLKRQLMSFRSNLWKENWECLEWLNKREPNSVVYVNFGSVTVMTDQHLKEFAWGLANSKHPFLWIVRSDIVMGDSVLLPQEFIEETKDRGLLAAWCPQDQVLLHPSVGVFLSHCGWNSTLESICGGVPMLCWPFFFEQQTNCRYACTEWGIGMEINHDVKRGEVENLIREMMEGEEGKKIRNKTLEWKKKAEEATDIGGSSYNNFDKLIKEVLHYGK